MSAPDLATALEVATAPKEAVTVRDLIERQKPAIRALLGSDEQTERLTRLMLTIFRNNEGLRECNPYSLLGAGMVCAQLDLEPGPLGFIYLTPFKGEVVTIIGYRGLVELAYRSGQVKDVSAELVYEGDVFRVTKGTSPKIVHEDAGPPDGREIVNAYAVARLTTGGTVFRVIWPEDWERARKASPAGSKNVGPWATDRAAMILKTAYRRLEPKLPKTPAVVRALQADETAPRFVEDGTSGTLEVEGAAK